MNNQHPIEQRRLLATLAVLLVLLAVSSLLVGSDPGPMLQALFSHPDQSSDILALILTEVRLPRVLIATLAGATLGLCGAAMQGLLRNPLATPGLTGSASGAALGAVIALYFGLSSQFALALPMAGMFGSLLAMVLVYLLAGRDASVTTLILAGVAINSLAMALISLLLNLAPSPYAVQELVLWILGSVTDRSLNDLWVMLPGTLLGWLLLLGSGRGLDALTLGEETATSMGIALNRLRWRLFIAIALAVGSAVSITGSIGFIGLVVPHLMRPLVGHQPGRLLTISALGGAIMLLLADLAVRLIPATTEIKVGVLTAVVGAPFFLWLIIHHRRSQT